MSKQAVQAMSMIRHAYAPTSTLLPLAALLCLGAVVVPSPASAQTPDWTASAKPPETIHHRGPVLTWDETRFGIALEGRTLWLRDDAAKRLVGSATSEGNGVSLLADVYRLTEAIVLRADASWLASTAKTYQTGTSLSESLKTDVVAVGASVRYQMLRWLAPFLRVSGGVGWDRVSIHTNQGDLKDRQVFPSGTVGVGIFLRTPCLRFGETMPWLRVRLNLHVEGGYVLAGDSDFTLKPSQGATGQTAIPQSPVALGGASRSAPFGRASFGFGF
jgi:hypothetical protein